MIFLSKLFTVSLIAVLWMQSALAHDEIAVATTQTELPKCTVDAKKALRGICMAVGGKDLDSSPQGRYIYAYQKKILQASCADIAKDSEEKIALKISKAWAANEHFLKCSNMQFDIQNGSIIKYAVNINNDEFIFDVARWKINFNTIDRADGKTVLDYVKDQKDRSAGRPIEATLKRYYSILREAGAKHAHEL